MVAKFKAPVNILFANTKHWRKSFWADVRIQLPEDEE